MTLLPNPKIKLKVSRGSVLFPPLPQKPGANLGLLDHKAQMAEQPAPQPGIAQLFVLLWAPLKPYNLDGCLINGLKEQRWYNLILDSEEAF